MTLLPAQNFPLSNISSFYKIVLMDGLIFCNGELKINSTEKSIPVLGIILRCWQQTFVKKLKFLKEKERYWDGRKV